jgi:hypothetical protein
MDIKLLHPVWKDFLDTVNTIVLTGYWKQLIIFLFDKQCLFQSGSECGPWKKIIGNSCLVIQKIHLDFLWFFYLQCKSMVEYILVCPLKRGCASKFSGFHCIYGYCIRCGVFIGLEYWWSHLGKFSPNIWKFVLNIA